MEHQRRDQQSDQPSSPDHEVGFLIIRDWILQNFTFYSKGTFYSKRTSINGPSTHASFILPGKRSHFCDPAQIRVDVYCELAPCTSDALVVEPFWNQKTSHEEHQKHSVMMFCTGHGSRAAVPASKLEALLAAPTCENTCTPVGPRTCPMFVCRRDCGDHIVLAAPGFECCRCGNNKTSASCMHAANYLLEGATWRHYGAIACRSRWSLRLSPDFEGN